MMSTTPRLYQPPASSTFLSEQTSQQYFSLRINQHQPSATSQTNRLPAAPVRCGVETCHDRASFVSCTSFVSAQHITFDSTHLTTVQPIKDRSHVRTVRCVRWDSPSSSLSYSALPDPAPAGPSHPPPACSPQRGGREAPPLYSTYT
jgi:hypothetical protein